MRARTAEIACGDRELAAGGRGDRGVSTTQLGAVDHIVVHERRRMHELDRHGGAHEPVLRIGGVAWSAGGLGGEHDQQRAQPLASGEDRPGGM